MIRDFIHATVRVAPTVTWSLVVLALLSGPATAAETEFEPLLTAQKIQALHVIDGKVLAGLDGGGILVGDEADPEIVERWTAGAELAGNDVRAMAWTGRYLWVATMGSGMTRIQDPGGTPAFRQYASNLGGLDVSAVAGKVIGTSERVFYGTAGQGLGVITDGLPGAVYTAEQDGLLSNNINDVLFLGDELFIATPSGISLFVDNAFSDRNDGLSEVDIRDLALDSDGLLIAGGAGGVHRWNPTTVSWDPIGNLGGPIAEVAGHQGSVYALRTGGVLYEFDGSVWTAVTKPEPGSLALFPGAELWVGGFAVTSNGFGSLTYAHLARRLPGGGFDAWRYDVAKVFDGMGVTFGRDGSPWMGDRNGFRISWRDADTWTHIYEKPHAGNDTWNLHPGLGPILTMTTGPEGYVYAGQYAGGGIVQIDPVARRTYLIDPTNSGLPGRWIVRLVTHPDGALIVMHDGNDAEMVDVMVEPDNWSDPNTWVTLTRSDGLGEGTAAWDAVVERRDVIWFAIAGVGLVRWDINGDLAGPDDPLTWYDKSDDRWDEPVASFPGTILDPTEARALETGAGGTIWAGGNGLVQFSYDQTTRDVEVWHAIGEKNSAGTVGLVNSAVADIAAIGDEIWVSATTGLNRVRTTRDEVDIRAWIDLRNYLANPDYGVLYSPSVIAPLSGMTYRRITASADGKQLLLSADQGVVLIHPAPPPVAGGGGTDPLASVYCYPNPWRPDTGRSGLHIAGLPGGADAGDPVTAELYNLEGQPIWRGTHTAGDTAWEFWDGRNRLDAYVSTGLYLLKVSWREWNTVRTVALVR